MVIPEYFCIHLLSKYGSNVIPVIITAPQYLFLIYIKAEYLHLIDKGIKRIYRFTSCFMSEPTLAQVFGDNASQNATQLIISKADLAVVGLTASATNNPEGLIVALLLKAAAYLNETTQSTNPDIQITIDEGNFQTLVTRNNANYRQATFAVTLQSPDITFTIDPDNY